MERCCCASAKAGWNPIVQYEQNKPLRRRIFNPVAATCSLVLPIRYRRQASFIQFGSKAHDRELVQPVEQASRHVVQFDGFLCCHG